MYYTVYTEYTVYTILYDTDYTIYTVCNNYITMNEHQSNLSKQKSEQKDILTEKK